MKKKITKQLERIAGKLPTVFRHTSEKHIVTGEEMLRDTEFKEVDGKPILPEERYVLRQPVQIAINHKRAMKKLVKKYGSAGAAAYIQAVNNHAQSNTVN